MLFLALLRCFPYDLPHKQVVAPSQKPSKELLGRVSQTNISRVFSHFVMIYFFTKRSAALTTLLLCLLFQHHSDHIYHVRITNRNELEFKKYLSPYLIMHSNCRNLKFNVYLISILEVIIIYFFNGLKVYYSF